MPNCMVRPGWNRAHDARHPSVADNNDNNHNGRAGRIAAVV